MLSNVPGSPIYDAKTPAYDASKSAVSAYTVHLAWGLKDTPIKVNAAHPGWVKTEMGGEGATMKIEDGAKTSVALATLGPDGPTAGFCIWVKHCLGEELSRRARCSDARRRLARKPNLLNVALRRYASRKGRRVRPPTTPR